MAVYIHCDGCRRAFDTVASDACPACGRTLAPRAAIASLEERIAALEAMLREQSAPAPAPLVVTRPPPPPTVRGALRTLVDAATSRLRRPLRRVFAAFATP